DIREAPALTIIERLLAAGVRDVVAHDPAAMANVRALLGDKVRLTEEMYDACEGADALAVVTEWHEFRRPDFKRLKTLLREPLVFHRRNLWDPNQLPPLRFPPYPTRRPH